jgi:hypothetical protein
MEIERQQRVVGVGEEHHNAARRSAALAWRRVSVDAGEELPVEP